MGGKWYGMRWDEEGDARQYSPRTYHLPNRRAITRPSNIQYCRRWDTPSSIAIAMHRVSDGANVELSRVCFFQASRLHFTSPAIPRSQSSARPPAVSAVCTSSLSCYFSSITLSHPEAPVIAPRLRVHPYRANTLGEVIGTSHIAGSCYGMCVFTAHTSCLRFAVGNVSHIA